VPGNRFDDRDRRPTGEVPGDLLLLRQRVEPIRRNAGQSHVRPFTVCKNVTDSTPAAAHVMVVHRLAQVM